MIRVGKYYFEGNEWICPFYQDFTSIVPSSLSPDVLRDEEGRILSNIWEASKVYPNVPYCLRKVSPNDPTVAWEWPKEKHLLLSGKEVKEILPEYYNWRGMLMRNPYPVKFLSGYHNPRKPFFFLESEDSEPINYITARKKIYCPLYINRIKEERHFKELKERHEKGENLLLIEPDGPHQESLPYYKEKYKVDDSFIEKNTLLATEENLKIMLNDTKHQFGYGYCLAAALQDINL